MHNHKILKKITLLSLIVSSLALSACGHNIKSSIKSKKLINTQNKNIETRNHKSNYINKKTNRVKPYKNNNQQSQKNSQTINSYLTLAKAQLDNKQWQSAQKNLLKAQSLNPKNAITQSYLGFYSQQVGETKQAQIHYKKALSLSPNNPEILNQYGVFLCKQNDFTQAIKTFDQAIRHKSFIQLYLAYQNKGLCLYKKLNNSKITLNSTNSKSSKNPKNPKTSKTTLDSTNSKSSKKIKQDIKRSLLAAIKHNKGLALSYLTLAELEYKDKHFKKSYNYLKEFNNLAIPNERSTSLKNNLEKRLQATSAKSTKAKPVDSHRLKHSNITPNPRATKSKNNTTSKS